MSHLFAGVVPQFAEEVMKNFSIVPMFSNIGFGAQTECEKLFPWPGEGRKWNAH
jgi:hypothetical protein